MTIAVNAITNGKIPMLANLAIRKEKREWLALANSRVVRKAIKVITAAIPINVASPKIAIVVTVVTVVTVVIVVFFPLLV